MLIDKLKDYRIILGSKSPRRHQLLKGIGVNFEIISPDIDESCPLSLKAQDIPLFLAQEKAKALKYLLTDNKTVIITADTIVWINNNVVNKPENYEDAVRMLSLLSGNVHEVFTGVCIKSLEKETTFFAKSKVFFKPLCKEEIDYYITHYKPYDKAGAYGIQEWIGYIGIEKIEGSFYNVMGLPITMLYDKIKFFLK